ncbi:hypothetical protein HaLaN_12512, partial [Haematococcus lacustris]
MKHMRLGYCATCRSTQQDLNVAASNIYSVKVVAHETVTHLYFASTATGRHQEGLGRRRLAWYRG